MESPDFSSLPDQSRDGTWQGSEPKRSNPQTPLPRVARKALRSSRSFMSPLLFPSMLLLLPSLPWEVFYKVFIRGPAWWDFERKNWNQREEKPAECEDWNRWKWEVARLSHATKKQLKQMTVHLYGHDEICTVAASRHPFRRPRHFFGRLMFICEPL